jgi:excisionase family DNA binding protein
VRRLGPTHTNVDLAARLHEAGYTTGAGRPFDATAVSNLRSYHRIAPVAVLGDGELAVTEVARRLGVSATTVYDWIKAGALAARRGPGGRLCVPFGADIERACRQRMAESTHVTRNASSAPAGPHERTVAQVASLLAISTNVVYYWLETGQVPARKGPGSRWLIAFDAHVEQACRRRIAASVHLKPSPKPQT